MKPMKALLVVGGVTGLTVAGVVVATRFSARRTSASTNPATEWLRQRIPAPIRSRLGVTDSSNLEGGASAYAENRAGASIVGNTKTRVYHQASDKVLPAEEHRAYFTSAEEAEAIGYRAAGSLP